MTTTDPEALREELRQLESTMDDLRRTAAAVRREVGGREDGPFDAADMAMLITEAEEQEALLSVLQARRERLQQRLEQATAS